MNTNRRGGRLGVALTALAVVALAVPALASPVLIDLGSDSSWRGLSVTNPDDNGSYWNSVWSGAFYPDLVDVTGAATDIDFGFSVAGGTDSYNGPAGDTSWGPPVDTVLGTDIDAAALGLLGGSLAGAFDFYDSTGAGTRMEIQGLDPTKLYNLTFFGSHKFSDDSFTEYRVYTDNTYTTLVDSAILQVQDEASPWLHNRDTTVTIGNLPPQTSDILYVEFSGANGGTGYLNAMMIEVVPEPATLMLLAGGCVALCIRRRR